MVDEPETWPKTVTVYIHSDKDSMWDEGEALGLTGEALSCFRHALGELAVTISVKRDGSYDIVSFKE